jgi:hypothetical protein
MKCPHSLKRDQFHRHNLRGAVINVKGVDPKLFVTNSPWPRPPVRHDGMRRIRLSFIISHSALIIGTVSENDTIRVSIYPSPEQLYEIGRRQSVRRSKIQQLGQLLDVGAQ